jgi:hypothetical protein
MFESLNRLLPKESEKFATFDRHLERNKKSLCRRNPSVYIHAHIENNNGRLLHIVVLYYPFKQYTYISYYLL